MISCCVYSLTTCCGVKDMGEFNSSEYSDYEADSPQELLDDVNESTRGYFIQAWFVRRKDWQENLYEEYETNDLREAVQKIDGVIHLGTAINPNSGNEIDGYMWLAK